jgi:hypothetical protein
MENDLGLVATLLVTWANARRRKQELGKNNSRGNRRVGRVKMIFQCRRERGYKYPEESLRIKAVSKRVRACRAGLPQLIGK